MVIYDGKAMHLHIPHRFINNKILIYQIIGAERLSIIANCEYMVVISSK